MFAYYLELAWRRCRQNVSMMLLVVLTMAIGIASCMTATTIFAALSGEPLPGISDHLYVVTMDSRTQGDADDEPYAKPQSLLNLRDAKALVDAHRADGQFAQAQSLAQVSTTDGKQSDRVVGIIGYGSLLTTLGVPFRYGRPWSEAEQAAHAPVVVIDAKLAERLFGTSNAVGRSVSMGTGTFRVIGVTAPWKSRTQFLGLTQNAGSPLGQDMRFFVPVGAALDNGVGPLNSGKCAKGAPVVNFQSTNVAQCRWIETWVSLRTPAHVTTYRDFLARYAQAQHQAGRYVHPPQAKLFVTQAWMDRLKAIPGDVGLNVMLAGGFLLLCMVNVAGLLAARFLRRQGHVAIRRALGASRRHVFMQHLVEAGVLGVAGGLLALPLTLLGLWVVRMQPVAYAEAARFSPGAFAVLAALSLLVGLVVGILPAWRVCRQPPALQIKVA
ncbi:ABC transporter permease [Oleiagrimonas soli]|uniref:ABC transporter n=1 Tax=Oleiagrimonas soli TaxID=1543381 RepID=A0A099CXA0_9GAMM|nr:ABC transporter permease [Oleiagrimonas soli]KGI78593.1 ABC transporter [Oleiagrimonas soli]MBB6184118.1 putative ABC transport system permease protein [Oleiagrimonas soli]